MNNVKSLCLKDAGAPRTQNRVVPEIAPPVGAEKLPWMSPVSQKYP